MSKLELNHAAPNFSLPMTNGENFNFSDHMEKHDSWHLLIFFRGAWCPVCVQDLKALEENVGYFKEKKVHIITVSSDKLDALKEMTEEHKLSFPVLSDENLEALKAYDVFYHGPDAPYEDHGTHGEPAYFLIDEKGRLLYQQRQTSPFGRPTATELRKIVQYIKKNIKG
ncbi:peroxiredoxin family protein [Sutcliffiella halmapala]